jgi:protein-tyrosine phosphatase
MRYTPALMGFVDLHSHVLPGIDDGSPDAATSLAMLRGLAGLGFDTICATPHQKAGQFMPSREQIDSAHSATRDALAGAGVVVELGLAAENMWDDVFHTRLEANQIPSYNGGNAFLVELQPSVLPLGLIDTIFRLRMIGKLPVLAHPERYHALWDDDDLVRKLAAECAMVVDLGAIAGYHGKREGKMARRLVEQGLAHAVASDAHSLNDVRVAAEGIAWIRKKHGDVVVERLLDAHPRSILAARHPED